MKKLGVFTLVLVLTLTIALAQDTNTPVPPPHPTPTGTVAEAYTCLENQIDNKDQSSLSLQEAIFSTLALGSNSKLTGAIDSHKNSDESCWPSASCEIKDTAQVLYAFERINKNSQPIQDWLISKSETAKELIWFLQIDISNHEQSSCALTYTDNERTITVKDDMKITGNAGSCFSISSSGYWLKINNNCIDETFRISCDKDFITSLLYQKQGSTTIFVSPTTNSAAASGTTEEKVNSKCFKKGTSCDYEGTLWAALALDNSGNDVKNYLPYLLALSSDNKRYLPSAFLHALTNGNDQYSELVKAQQQSKYWQAPNTQYNRFYDTSLALLALQGTGAQEITNSLDYLLSIQTPEGCWNSNNIRDTAFLLFAGWPKTVASAGGSSVQSCKASGFNCASSLFVCADAGGDALDFDCDSGVCCSVSLIPPTCDEQLGLICSASQECSGKKVNSLEGSCCLGACLEISKSNECESLGGSCFTECTSNEDETTSVCDEPGLICCVPKLQDEGGSNLWLWIIILILLIGLTIAAIVFRKKLQLWRFKIMEKGKKRKKKGPPPTSQSGKPPYPGYPPRGMRRPPPGYRPGARPMMRRRPPPYRRASQSQTDKELDETLKKLREMSK